MTRRAKKSSINKRAPRTYKSYWQDVFSSNASIGFKFSIVAVGILLIAGAILRLLSLDGLSLWMDEYVHVNHAISVTQRGSDLIGGDNNGILYTFFLLPLFSFFEPTTFLARVPSVFFGSTSILLVWFVARTWLNNAIALLSSFLICISVYQVYWSKLARNYAIFEFFYLILIVVFWLAWTNHKSKRLSWLNYSILGVSLPWLLLLPVALIFSLISHNLTFLFVFSIAIYLIIIALFDYTTKREMSWKYTGLALPSFIFLALLFTPFFESFIRSILGVFVPPNIVELISLDWNRLMYLFNSDPYGGFFMYWDIITEEWSWFHLFGLIGFASSIKINLKAGVYLNCLFWVPLLLMSFIYREPNLPRYFIFLHPLYMIAMAVGIWVVIQTTLYFIERLSVPVPFRGHLALGLSTLIIIPFIHTDDLNSLANATKKSGYVVSPTFTKWSFTNWKDVYERATSEIEVDEIVMSTVPQSTQFYLNHPNIIWFRQTEYSPTENRYVFRDVESSSNSAASYQNLVRTVQSSDSGWLFADYYFYNVLTDPRARMWVYQNMHFYPEYSPNGDIQVFRWDKEKGDPLNQSLVVELGKPGGRNLSEAFTINLSNQDDVSMSIRVKGIDTESEALLAINGTQNLMRLPKNTTNEFEYVTVQIPKNLLNNGQNQIQFAYNTDVNYDGYPGYLVLDVRF